MALPVTNCVQKEGDGCQIVFVHAVGLDLGWWSEVIGALPQNRGWLAYDLPAHGLSHPLTGPITLSSLAEHLDEVIDENYSSQPVHLVGLSVGGMIAQVYAARKPDDIRTLTLIDTACTLSPAARNAMRKRADLVLHDGMDAIVEATLDRWFSPNFRRFRPDIIDRCVKTLLAADPEVHAAMWRAIAELETEKLLKSIRKPACVIVGEMDPSTPVESARRIVEALPNAQLKIIKEASHLPIIESALQVADALMACINLAE